MSRLIEKSPSLAQRSSWRPAGAAIRRSPWIYPAANVGHIIFLVSFAGAVAVLVAEPRVERHRGRRRFRTYSGGAA